MPLPDHDGCGYPAKADCKRRGCKPAEDCPAGHVVYRNEYGGHHHER